MALYDGNSTPTCARNSLRDRHQEHFTVSKKLEQGRVLKNLQEEFLSQNEERECVDVLLDFSTEEENLDVIVNSFNWEEVARGWRPTVPNVTYITRAKEPDSKKDSDIDKDRSRNAQLIRLLQIEKDLSWKHCIEPGTYRYKYKSPYPGVRKRKLGKGLVDTNLQQHVRKVREHLERVFAQQASQKLKQRPLGAVCNHVDYVTSLTRDTKPSQNQPKVETIFAPDTPSQEIKTTIPDVGLTYTLKHGNSSIQKSPVPQQLHEPLEPVKKPTVDLVATMGSKLNDLIEHDNLKIGQGTTRHSKKKMRGKLRSSYETFTSNAQVESPSLKPLVKVTPSQRKIHDDNELIKAVAKMNKRLGFPSDEGYSGHSPALTLPDHESLELRKELAPNPRFRLLDPANSNFFTSGISGKAVCSSDVQVDIQNLESVSTEQKKGSRLSSKQRAQEVVGHGDHRLHRGVADRGMAGAIAARILPGVNGHQIQFPLQHAYRII